MAGPVDITVRFGSQVRHKCPTCTKFVKPSADTVKCAGCGTHMVRVPGNRWRIDDR